MLHSRPTNYWIRLNREELTTNEIPDQVVLHALDNWKSDHSQSVYKGLNLSEAVFRIDGFAEKFEHFGKSLDGYSIRSLSEELFELIRKEGGNIPKEAHYHGFIELWRLSLDQPVSEHDKWILGEIKKTIPISLRFANELYYYWRHHDHDMVTAKEQTTMLRNGFIEEARKVYENNGQVLINALDPAYMYSIYQFMINYSEKGGGGTGFNPVEWEWLIDVLLEAGKANPQVVIPQLVPIVSNEASTFREGFSYSINEERLNSLFGSKKSTVIKLLAMKIDTSMFDEREKNRIDYVHREAVGRILE
jgi:hypothetical protein